MKHPYADFLADVEKPARYLGGEHHESRKPLAGARARVCLAFPDVYEIGMSHLGTKILYGVLGRTPGIACERAFAPWLDMEAELRRRGLPLLTLESAAPLATFDVVGFSLQYELTYTNVLAMLDLGGIPVRAADRGDDAPLVLAGGPNATHPEPMAPFIDAFFIGEAEEKLPALCLEFADLRRAGVSRRERLVRLAERYPLYCPDLYAVERDAETGLLVVGAPLDARVPARPRREWVADINRFPFPDDSPLPWAEAIFDRMAVEIARGCTEGCRFCQAGMIYRPVRERDPVAVIDALCAGVRKGGYDETALTSLSTADYSCVTPLVKAAMAKLRDEKVSLAVSSLRAYGLNDDLLRDMSQMRAQGLTFAPEAGTQRMRDVITKNVTEEDIVASAERVFGSGFQRMKLYFMIGLPTEEDADVLGIVETASRVQRIGRRHLPGAAVTASVSTHVPKPHTPFQWAAMDSEIEIERKQRVLSDAARRLRVDLKMHENRQSHLEGIFARGDRAAGDLVERAFRLGCRFDGWDDVVRIDLWEQALTELRAETGLDVERYLGTLPVTARLPWDHIEIGLVPGFLLEEYRKALKDRLSPPCGKPWKQLLHPASVEEAHLAAKAKLVCYDCGIGCDLDRMKAERLFYLKRMNGWTKSPTPEGRPVGGRAAGPAPGGPIVPASGPARAGPRGESGAVGAGPAPGGPIAPAAGPARAGPRGQVFPRRGPVTSLPAQSDAVRWRIKYTKLGRLAFLGHLDLIRHLPRVFRRAGVDLLYTAGFHPKPEITFGPALGLGMASLGEMLEIRILDRIESDDLLRRLADATLEGLSFVAAAPLADRDRGLGRVVDAALWLARLPADAAAEAVARFRSDVPLSVRRQGDGGRSAHGIGRTVDVRQSLRGVEICDDRGLRRALGWPDGYALLRFATRVSHEGSARPVEVIEALLGADVGGDAEIARIGLLAAGGDPIDLERLRWSPSAPSWSIQSEATT